MIYRIFLLYFKIDLRNYFQSKLAFVGHLFGIYLNLLIYWYTSEVFSGSVENSLTNYQMSYFDYLLISDLMLQACLSIIESNSNHFFMLKVNKVSEYLKTCKYDEQALFFIRSFAQLPRQISFILIYFFMGKIFFNFSLSFMDLLFGLLLQILIFPSFIGLSLFALSFFNYFGRGLSIVGFFNTIASIVAGGYFPVEVLPAFIRENTLYLGPLNTLLYGYRTIIINYEIDLIFTVLGLIAFWNITFLGLGLIFFRMLAVLESRDGKKYIFDK